MKKPNVMRRRTVISVSQPREIFSGAATPKKICGARQMLLRNALDVGVSEVGRKIKKGNGGQNNHQGS